MAASYTISDSYDGSLYTAIVHYFTEEEETYTVHGIDDVPGAEDPRWHKSFNKTDIDTAGLLDKGELLLLPELVNDSRKRLRDLKAWVASGGSLQGASIHEGRTVVVRGYDDDDKLYAYLFDLVSNTPGEQYLANTRLFKTNDTTNLRIPNQYSLQRVLNGIHSSVGGAFHIGGFKQLSPIVYEYS